MSRMRRFEWFRRERSSRTKTSPRHDRRLRIESLEDRRMLSFITVTSLTDDLIVGDGVTLREAIYAANLDISVDGSEAGFFADTIIFDASLFATPQTITLSRGDLDITEALTIDARSLPQNVTIDANGLSRIFNITVGAGNVTLDGLSLTGGRTTGDNLNSADLTHAGGGIRFLSDGALTLASSILSGNSTAGTLARGGGIFSLGSVSLISSTLSGNSTAGNYAHGGGIYTSSGVVTLTSSTLSGNSTAGFGADGGGIHFRGSTVTLTSSTISGNSTTGDRSDGGAIYSQGAVTLASSTVSGNSTAGLLADGGGIYSKGAVTLMHSTITDNHANGVSATAGGLWNLDDPVTITNSIVAGNTAGGGSPDIRPGTGIFAVNFSLIGDRAGTGLAEAQAPDASGNLIGSAAGAGIIDPLLGPIANNGGPTQTHALLAGSLAIDAGDPGIALNFAEFDQRGAPFVRVFFSRIDMGAFELHYGFPAQGLVVDTVSDLFDGDFTIGNLALREAVFWANLNPLADTITFDASLSGQTITLGGTELEISEALTIDATALDANVTIDGNMQSRVLHINAATGDFTLAGLNLTGGRTIDGDFTGGGGGIHIRFEYISTLTLTLNNCTVSGNSTTDADASGGGIFSGSGAVTLTDSIVSGNSTAGSNARGSGIYAISGAVTLTNSTVSGNSTTGSAAHGGGIFTASGAVTLMDSTVSGNSTAGFFADGGGILTYSGAVTLTGSTVSGNSTTGNSADSGGIYTRFGDVTLTGSTVSGNSSGNGGGGIHTNSGAVTLTRSTVSDNHSYGNDTYGGGIHTNSGAVTLTRSTVSDNSATESFFSGGGIGTFSGAVTLTGSTVSGNSSGRSGGGIYTRHGDVMLTDSTVSGNSSDSGGGIGTTEGAVTLTSSTVTGNSTYGFGGGVFIRGFATNPTLTIANSIVAGNTAIGAGPDLMPDPDSTLVVDFSLIGDTTDSGITVGTGTGNILNQSALLGPLADNGGSTLTHALMVGSPAIDAGDPDVGPSVFLFDQRGAPFIRVVNNPTIPGFRVDIGAYERQFVAGLNLTVDTNVDENDGVYSAGNLSLREAVGLANGSIGANTILFAATLSGQTITLGGTELLITDTLTIDATALAANVTIDANMQSRVIRFSTNPGDLTLSGLTITGGRTIGEFEDGGGILFGSNSTLTLNSSTVSGNSTTGSNANGGGIRTYGGAVTLTDSTVSGNSTAGALANGGGIRTFQGAVTLTGSTVSGNITTGIGANGGGIFTNTGAVILTGSTVSGNSTTGTFADGGGIFTLYGAVTLTSSTVTGNSAAGWGGGVYSYDSSNNPTLTIANSIVAGNTAVGQGPDLKPDSSSFLNVNFSLIGDTTGSGIFAGTGSGNILNQAPQLGLLANNGGSTLTHALMVGSPAIDAGNPSIVPNPAEFDQRGAPFVRVFDDLAAVGTGIDIGAYERQTLPGLSLVVDTNIDENDGDYSASDLSLREAVDLAAGGLGTDTITFDAALTGSTIFLVHGELVISSDVTLAGLGADVLTIDAQGMSRVIRIFDSATVAISGLTLTGGNDNRGGAIHNSDGGTVNVTSSTISGSSATSGGGAIYNTGTLTVTDSTISGSSVPSSRGGGIFNSGMANVTSSTISGNLAEYGGGIWNHSSGTVTVTSSTISGNSAIDEGGGISNNGNANVTHTIVAGNIAGSDADVFGSLNTNTFNLIGGDPMLGALQDNGGPTETHALLPGSPAIDMGDIAASPGVGNVPLFDQRGDNYGRVQNGRIDIGAFEVQPIAASADFDGDGDVDGRDFLAWQRGLGTSPAAKTDGDADNDLDVDGDDLDVWQLQYGTVPPMVATLAVGEPVESVSLLASTTEDPLTSYQAAIDAAMALNLFEESGEPQLVPLTESPWEQEISYDSMFADDTFLPRGGGTEEVDFGFIDSKDAEEVSEGWLTEEQLEQVFG
ncbi:choice-of-anchor Q domain-containing protein [Bythopirellula polymerisocia]|uniref:Probable pectate lyase C n=1 Tax=Bythopirellula polymerisocia TaxID=2528003 RepID=A0A5C6CKM1_9BACT|nr:choice-of-anchor Q domain-containing protein [Bythopirellula polymerisocia]TWU24605.1 Planctomycete extracellular [Bythopirellula polymerisocia]